MEQIRIEFEGYKRAMKKGMASATEDCIPIKELIDKLKELHESNPNLMIGLNNFDDELWLFNKNENEDSNEYFIPLISIN